MGRFLSRTHRMRTVLLSAALIAAVGCESSPKAEDTALPCTQGTERLDTGVCTDIDECTEGADTCADDAVCTNTPGAYTCECNAGFTGDGIVCTDIDECTEGTDTCADNALCTNTPGAYTCECNAGFAGDGVVCTDIDECTEGTDTCADNAVCTNTSGDYTCECNAGFAGDGILCTDIDECTEGTDTCGPFTECENTPGSHLCPCIPEFELAPDGTCVPIDPCYFDPCGNNGTCNLLDGSCACTLGWTGPTCDLPGEIVQMNIVDQDGEPVLGSAVLVGGQWVDLPGATTVLEGSAMNATSIGVCNGIRPLPGLPIVPSADTTITHSVDDGAQAIETTPGQRAVSFLIVHPYKPVAWFPYDDASSAVSFRTDIVDGWRAQNSVPVTQQVAGTVGSGVAWTSNPNVTLQHYARLTPSGDIFPGDASFKQRDWLKSESFTVEFLVHNTEIFITGTMCRYLALFNRLEFYRKANYFHLDTSAGDAYFTLDGTELASQDYHLNGWHHYAITYDSSTGALRLWVDGYNPDTFVHYFAPGTVLANANRFELGGGPFWQSPVEFDDIAFFDGVLPNTLIYAHATDALQQNLPYAACLRPLTIPPTPDVTTPPPGGREPRYYAPGLPEYAVVDGHPRSVSQLEQLESFPLPRFHPEHTLLPQMSWLGDQYLAGQNQPGQPTGSALQEATAIIHAELSTHWHYYYSVPSITYPNPTHPMVDVANAHPEWNTFAIGLWPQLKPNTHTEVFDQADWDYMDSLGISPSNTPFISTPYPTLSLEHVPNDGTEPLYTSNYQSPAAPAYTWRLDGKVQRKGFQTMLEALAPRKAAGALPIDHYNENGEVLTVHQLNATMAQDPVIIDMMANWDPDSVDESTNPPTIYAEPHPSNYKLFLGHAAYVMRAAYLAPLREEADAQDTIFSWYAVDGNRQYRPFYEHARLIQTPVDGMRRATPDFYPRKPAWWDVGAGAWHGYQWLGTARKFEIDQGDTLYWPFITPGWANSPMTNIGAGQWLGLLKIVAALGADSWYVAHFSLGPPPNFPQAEGWIWQAAAASYAQAITSRYEDILRDGELVQARSSWIPQAWYYEDYFRLYTGKPKNEIVVARRLGDEWLLAGAISPETYDAGKLPMHAIAQVQHDFDDDGNKETLRIPVRRQGSVYRWNRGVEPPTLIQLDAWHEPWHPWHWTRDFHIDAEVHDGLVSGTSSHAWKVFTDAPLAPDYTGFTTLLEVVPADTTMWSSTDEPGSSTLMEAPSATYTFAPRSLCDLHVWVRARTKDGSASTVYVHLDENQAGVQSGALAVDASEWTWVHMDTTTDMPLVFTDVSAAEHIEPDDGSPHYNTHHTLTLRPGTAQLEIDRFILSRDNHFHPDQHAQPEQVTEVGSTLPATLKDGLIWRLSSQSGVTTKPSGTVESWSDVDNPNQILLASNGPNLITLDSEKPVLAFDGSQALTAPIGHELTAATILLRVRLADVQNDNDFFYSIGSSAAMMSLSNGGAVDAAPDLGLDAASYYWDGSTSYSGEGMYPDRFITIVQVFYDAPQGDGVTHRLFIDGKDANVGGNMLYSLDSNEPFVIGGFASNGTAGFEGELAEVLIYNRALPYWEHQSVSSYLWNRM